MALSKHNTSNQVTIFRNKLIKEYVRGNMFSPYMQEDGSSVITSFTETGKYGGDHINVPLLRVLNGEGVGTGTLHGNEEDMSSAGWRVWLDWSRNAVVAKKSDIKKGSFDLMAQAAPALSSWGKVKQRDDIVKAFMALPSNAPQTGLNSAQGQTINGVQYAAATAGQKNTWHDANADRILYGSQRGNFVAGNHAASLANVDATNDKASAQVIRVIKDMAEKADPAIEPLTTDDGYERYVLFVGSNAFRDLEADPDIYQANKDARPREGRSYRDNPIFMDSDLLYHGVIIRKIPQIDKYSTITGAGASSVNVAPIYLCGRNALGMLWGQLPEPTKLDETDYQFLKGVGIEMAYGVSKIAYQKENGDLIQWGVVTGFVASTDNA